MVYKATQSLSSSGQVSQLYTYTSFKLRSITFGGTFVHDYTYTYTCTCSPSYLRRYFVLPYESTFVPSKVLCTFENTSGSTVYSGTRVHVRVQRCTRIIMLYSTVVYFRKYRNIITFVQPNVLKESHSWRARPSRSRKVRNSPKEPRLAFLVT